MIKLSKWCKKHNVSYTTGYNLFKQNKLPCRSQQLETGTILVEDDPKTSCRVTDERTGRSFIIELDLDINSCGLAGKDQKEILEGINRLADLIAEKIGLGVTLNKMWIP